MTIACRIRAVLLASALAMNQLPALAQSDSAEAPANGGGASDGSTDLKEVVVTGIRKSMQSALEIKRDAPEVVDSIVAQDIGKLPDPNVADSLQRIPGIQLYRYAGEGLYAVIRGLVDQNRTELNGRSYFTPSAAVGGGRDFQPDNAQPELVSGLDVYKNPSADHIEGAIGGLVNIKTHKPFDFPGFQATVSAKENYYDFANAARPTLFALVSNRWDTGIGDLGALISGGYQKTAMRQDSIGTSNNNFTPRPYLSAGKDLNGDGAVNAGDYIMAPNGFNEQLIYGYRERIGADGSIQLRPSDTLQLNLDGNYNQYTYNQDSYNISAGLAGSARAASNVVTTPYSTYTTAADHAANSAIPAGTLVGGYDLASATFSNVPLTTNGDMSIDHPVNYQFALSGQWKPVQALTVSGEFAYTHSLEKKTYRILNYATVPGDTWNVTQDLTGSAQSIVVDGANSLSAPGTFNFLNYSKSFGETALQERAGRMDAHYDLNDTPFFKVLSTGVRWNEVNYTSDGNNASAYTYTIADQAGNPISAAGSGLYTNAFTNFFRGNTNGVGGFIAAPVGILDNQAGLINAFPYAYRTIGGVKTYGIDGGDPVFYSLNHFSVTEKTYAIYGTTDFAFHAGLPVDGNVGVRVVRTDGTTLGYQVNPDPTKQPVAGSPTYDYAVPSTKDYSYTDVLPSLNVKVHLTDEWLVRFGASKGMNRPGFALLSPAFTGINYAPGAYPVGTVPLGNVGNPDLKPAHSKNFDLALEYYFSQSGYAYVSTFYKKVTGFIINYAQFQDLGLKDVAGNPALALITAPINSADGTIKGAEAGVQTFFDFLPAPFDGFGVQVNYTYVDSKQQVPLGPSSAPVFVETQLPNLSKDSYNVVGMYEKHGLTARLAWGYRTAYYRSQFGGGLPNLPLITPAYGTLDGSISYDVDTHLSVSFDAANITNSAPDRFSGGLADRPVQDYTYDRRYGVGVRYRF